MKKFEKDLITIDLDNSIKNENNIIFSMRNIAVFNKNNRNFKKKFKNFCQNNFKI